jgi:hypothetical protein
MARQVCEDIWKTAGSKDKERIMFGSEEYHKLRDLGRII